MARAIWKGLLRFGHTSVPVKFYSAVEDRGVHLRLLDRKSHEPVKEKMVDSETGKVVAPEDIRRAYPTGDRELVLLEPEELKEVQPEPSREITITRFVESKRIAHQWYDRPYFLGPDDSEDDYFALADALQAEDRLGVAHWVMRDKEYVGALRAEGDYLMIITLRHRGEVVATESLEAPPGRELSAREIAIAKQLVTAMEEDDFDLTTFHDEYRERVLDLVHAKAEGKVIRFPRAKRQVKERSLEDLLEKSVATRQER